MDAPFDAKETLVGTRAVRPATVKHLPQEYRGRRCVILSPMSCRSGFSLILRGAAASLTALLLSVPVLAAPRPTETASCCRQAEATMGCCVNGHVPADSSANCCRLSAPEEAAPALQSPAAPTLAAPSATAFDQPLPPLTASLVRPERRVAPRARSAPLFLLFAALVV